MAKKSNSTPWIIGGLAIAGFGIARWLRSQAALIQFGNVSIPFQQLKGGQINLVLSLPITNASSLAARITGFTGFIVSPSGNPVSSVFLKAPAYVPRYQQATLEFTSSIRLTDAAAEIADILQSGQFDPKGYRLVGQVRVYGIPVPVEMPVV